ncbi:hypothetical protein CEW82_08020 [Lactiplantibacillus pentosus]|nr:hypothetical protein CEW82_08020 [Lactiplantibacillus pentosus]
MILNIRMLVSLVVNFKGKRIGRETDLWFLVLFHCQDPLCHGRFLFFANAIRINYRICHKKTNLEYSVQLLKKDRERSVSSSEEQSYL